MQITSKHIVIIGVVLGLMTAVSTMDFHDEVKAEAIYISDVCNGIHPDYLNLNPKCGEADVQ